MKRSLLAAIALLGLASPAAAFWEYGHETVATIAYANVTPKTRPRSDRLLAQQALLDTPTCPARTIEQASVWADCIKPLKPPTAIAFGYAYNWHYPERRRLHAVRPHAEPARTAIASRRRSTAT